MGFIRGILITVLLVAAADQLASKAAAVTYVVGDSMGWTVPSSPGFYATYASQHVFVVGDVLVFNFTTGFHDVARVTRSGFDACSSSNPIALSTIGPASFTLNSTGPDYYICTFGEHCSEGQSLFINVVASTSPPTPAPTPPPSSMTPPPAMMTPPPSSMTPPPTMMTPPPSSMTPSSAPALPPSSMMPPPAMAPSPSSNTPSLSPTPMSPSGAPGSAPGLAPSSDMTPPPSPMAPASTPGPSADTGGPPGSFATRMNFGFPLAIVGSIVVGLMI